MTTARASPEVLSMGFPPANARAALEMVGFEVAVGLGRIAALHYCSSTLY